MLIGVLPEFHRDQQPEAGGGPLLQRRGQRDVRARLRARRIRQGEPARASTTAVGKYVKINDTWLQVIGVLAHAGHRRYATSRVWKWSNRNNLVIAPLNTVMRRFEDNNSYLKDEIDGIYIKVSHGTDSIETANVVQRHPDAHAQGRRRFHRGGAGRPAGAERRRTQFIFKVVMICIAGISLLVGGIGIMNIMLATVLERTREIGIRRAIGARQADIVRQFLTEAVLISIVGGLIGIAFGFTLSQIIAAAAGWSTVVTTSSIAVAFGVSVASDCCSAFIRRCRPRSWIRSRRSGTNSDNTI